MAAWHDPHTETTRPVVYHAVAQGTQPGMVFWKCDRSPNLPSGPLRVSKQGILFLLALIRQGLTW
jgi:hypothetical protein